MSHGNQYVETIVRTFVELNFIQEPIEAIKSGKEATVFRCRAHSERMREHYALKVYRPRTQRAFKNDAVYREGSMITRIGGGNTRAARALRAGTRFGRQVQEFTWGGHEWEIMQRLFAAGLAVPEPVYMAEGAILMELFARPDGAVAPPLARARLDRRKARGLFDALSFAVEQLLSLDLIHGDLSPYNILWNGEEYRIIDFPQAIDARFHGDALGLLTRDLDNVANFCGRFADVPGAAVTAAEMWGRYQRGEL